jgi:hypothetical protein
MPGLIHLNGCFGASFSKQMRYFVEGGHVECRWNWLFKMALSMLNIDGGH